MVQTWYKEVINIQCFMCYYTMMKETFKDNETDYSQMYLDLYNLHKELEGDIVDCGSCGRRVRYDRIDNGKHLEVIVPIIKTKNIRFYKLEKGDLNG